MLLMPFLEFTFQSFGHFLGVCVLLLIVCLTVEGIVVSVARMVVIACTKRSRQLKGDQS